MKAYRLMRGEQSSAVDGYVNQDINNWDDYVEVEEYYCSQFGCGMKLTLQESLYGPRCNKHLKEAATVSNGYL